MSFDSDGSHQNSFSEKTSVNSTFIKRVPKSQKSMTPRKNIDTTVK
jgi:hypothetical protein